MSEKIYVFDKIIAEPISTLVLRKKWWPHILCRSTFLESVREAAGEIGLESPILWLFTPISAPAIGQFDEGLVVFDAIDNWMEHPGLADYQEAARGGYQAIKMKADLAFCCSEDMRRFLSGGKPSVYWVPNGVDTGLFNPRVSFPMPADIANIPSPRIGYAGMIDTRVDFDLLDFCAIAMPEMNFVLVGPALANQVQLDRLLRHKNVFALGRKQYQEMPAYINSFDACLIPHRVTPHTQAMNPLKLYEYLACGKPVISTPIAGSETFENVIFVAGERQGFAQAIKQALEEDAGEIKAICRQAVVHHTWSMRVEWMWDQVKEELGINHTNVPLTKVGNRGL